MKSSASFAFLLFQIKSLLVFYAFFALQVSANSTGITGYSGQQGSTCNSCHTGTNYNATLSYSGVTSVEPSTETALQLVLSFTSPSGVTNPHAGINISVTDGSLIAGSTTRTSNNELVHTSPVSANNDQVTWDFTWSSPATEGSYTIYACSQAVDRNFNNTGDDSGGACIEQQIAVLLSDSEPDPESQADTSSSPSGDIDNDGRSDFLVWRPSTQTYYSKSSDTGSVIHRQVIGSNQSGVPLAGDIDGNGITDFAVWDPSTGIWEIYYDSGASDSFTLGQDGDYPFLADRDGDAKDDIMVRRPSEGVWYYLASASNYQQQSFAYGNEATDIPVLGHYDTDGRIDFAIKRGSTWYMRWSSDNQTRTHTLGTRDEDVPVPADYDGDGLTDRAIWRPSTGTWYIDYASGASRYTRVFGRQSTDIPVPADYDGDGKADLAIRRPATFQFYYVSSVTGAIVTTEFGKQDADIPTLASWKALQTLLIEPDNDSDHDGETAAESYYQNNISEQIIQSQCIACHTSSGSASASRLQFVTASTDNYQTFNQQTWSDFMALSDVDTDYVLNKVQGNLAHGGGTQLAFGTELYNALAEYLELLTGDSGASDTNDFWEGAATLNNADTLRKATLLFAGRLPTESEYVSVASNSESALRSAIRASMTGENFHQFILEGANDRLLTDKWLERFAEFLDSGGYFPESVLLRITYENEERVDDYWTFYNQARYAYARAPLKLIAHVVENELPYSEILTADYTFTNPQLDFFYRGTASFNNSNDQYEFQQSQINQMIYDEELEIDRENAVIISEGSSVTWPHAGILNDPAWLSRYPSTDTNRNRARARWTYYHFLGFDIEKSVARTNDPEALADTNNPTLNNPNCTVCHEIMDPLAGAYQNYGDLGHYRDSWGGMDSLADSYREQWVYDPQLDEWVENDSPYQEGDTWYRDMLAPGFNGLDAPSNDNSLQWLAEQIVTDPRFATATAKFWWPAVTGSEAASAPEESSDADYQAKAAVFAAQSQFIATIAQDFSANMNLKDLLTDIAMSEWFRAVEVPENMQALHATNKNGLGRLLSPELLDRKLKAITGGAWNERFPEWNGGQRQTDLINTYRLTYGGIDSDGITKRAEEMTSIMSQVALAQAAEMACGIVVGDFVVTDGQRTLFNRIEKTDTSEAAIKNKLTELHYKFWGENDQLDSEEIERSYQLFVASRNARMQREQNQVIFEEARHCNYDFSQHNDENGEGGWYVAGHDPNYTMAAWRTVIAYLMSDYRFLHE